MSDAIRPNGQSCLDYRITTFFEGAVAGLIEDTIFEDEVMAIAERLGAGDATADKAEIFGVPTEVLTFDLGVVYSNVLGLPKGIFGVENSVVNLDILRVLENVLADQLHLVNTETLSAHKGI